MRRASAFTLVEVLVALAIFGIAAIAMLQHVTATSATESRITTRMYARWVAENQLAQVRLKPHWPSIGITRGDTEKEMGREWHWEMKVLETSSKRLRRVELTIRRDADQKVVDARLTAFIGRY